MLPFFYMTLQGLRRRSFHFGGESSSPIMSTFWNDSRRNRDSRGLYDGICMSSAAFKRDINDPKTIEDFTAIVRSPERLRLLLVLTVADIRAVGPNVWNS